MDTKAGPTKAKEVVVFPGSRISCKQANGGRIHLREASSRYFNAVACVNCTCHASCKPSNGHKRRHK